MLWTVGSVHHRNVLVESADKKRLFESSQTVHLASARPVAIHLFKSVLPLSEFQYVLVFLLELVIVGSQLVRCRIQNFS